MLMALKTPMGIFCHCILSPLLFAFTISQHSVCVSVSKPLRADQSPFAASAPGCFHHPFPLSLCVFLSYISTPLPFFNPLSPFILFLSLVWSLWSLLVLNFPQFPCPVISLLHLILFSRGRPPPPSFPLLSYSLLEEEDKM